MAFPFKTGGDFYNCEAQRMRLHNLGANPTETATGLMYFNTGASNLGKHAVVHDGTNFKALAFVDEIATNDAFTKLDERVLTIEKALGEDTANVIDTWEEIQNFLKDINANDANLMTMLNSKLDKSGGTIESTQSIPLYIKSGHGTECAIGFGANNTKGYGYLVFKGGDAWSVTKEQWSAEYTLLHSGNIGEYKAGGLAHSNGTVGAVVNSSGNVTIGAEDKAGTSYKLYVDVAAAAPLLRFVNNDGTTGSYIGRASIGHDDILLYIPTANDFYIATNGTERMRVTSNGNVGIGIVNPQYELDVNGGVRTKGVYVAKDYGLFLAAGNEGIYLSNNSLHWHGTDNGWKSSLMNFAEDEVTLHKKMTINGDLHVTGNIIADKEVSAGGAGTEGESGDGGAEVISQQLAKGQSTYTITNTIKRSDIAVSLYEANVINGQTIWSLCLADIEVTNTTITVTFGSATSVNHKLVAVG